MAGYVNGKVEIFCGDTPPYNLNVIWMRRNVGSDNASTFDLLWFDNISLTWIEYTGPELNNIESIVAGENITIDVSDPKNPIINATSIPINLVLFKRGIDPPAPTTFKWINNITVTNVLLMNCSEISVTIGNISYNHTTLMGVTLTAGTQLVINDITVVAGQSSADAIIIF